MKTPTSIVTIFCLIFTLSGCFFSKNKVRIVLITLDTLRFDAMFGTPEKPSMMPQTLQFAKNGAIYTKFFSSTSTTQPSHATMFTGLHPWQNGVTRNGQVLGENYETIAEILKDNGFTTSAVIASYPLNREMGFAQGFDHYSEDFTFRYDNNPDKEPQYALADSIANKSLLALDNAKGEKQFFWFHFFDPHEPYGSCLGKDKSIILKSLFDKDASEGKSPEYLMEMVNHSHQLYDADVAYLDKELAKILKILTDQDDEYDTHIIVVSDHGESFGEDGSISHGRRLTPSQIHVPCFIISPQIISEVGQDVAGSIDIMPTVLSLAKTNNKHSLGGRDLTKKTTDAPQAFGMLRTYEKPFTEYRVDGKAYTIDANLFYYVDSEGEIFRGNKNKLLDNDRINTNQTQQKELMQIFSGFEAELTGSSPRVLDNPKALKALKSLGYIQ